MPVKSFITTNTLPIPEEKAEDLPPWLLHTRRERTYLPLFTSVKTA